MEENKEGLEPQKIQETVVPTDTVTVSKQELDDLKHKAEVSSQNFERLKKAEQDKAGLEAKLAELNEVPSDYEDEAVKGLKSDLADIKGKLAKTEVLETYPQLKEVWNDFEKFRMEDDNRGMNLKTSAKAFLTEKGLLDPQRKGLEKPSGGQRVPFSSGMTTEEVKNLRETNYKKYLDLLKKGDIKLS